MATSDSDTAIDSFLELERRFEEFVRVVPIAPEHNRVYSPVLASLLLDVCSLLETVLKSSMDNARYNGIPNIAWLRARRYADTPPFLNIGHMRSVFRSDTFYTKPVWYLPRGESSYPWHVWRLGSGNPKWWDSYNAVKHSRFANARKATLLDTLHAMKGLFLALIQSLEFRDRLVERGFLRSRVLSMRELKLTVATWEPFDLAVVPPVVISTRLFGYKYLATASPDRARDATVFL